MRHDIPTGAQHIIYTLKSYGYKAYLVGGCVRDLLMDRQPNDWDICTSATPEEMKKCFLGWTTIDTGLRHGTITVVLGGNSYEVTTFRVDGTYSDGRHPDNVQFTTNLVADLARRDFTINAIAMTVDGIICDPFGGQHDIDAKVIRCVGDPRERFMEDGLRIMRALRFAATLGFGIEVDTIAAMHDCKDNLRNIAAERIMTELKKLVVGKKSGATLNPYHDILSIFWPEIEECAGFEQRNKYHVFDVWTHMTVALDKADTDDLYVRLALLLHDIAKPRCFTLGEDGYGHFYGHPPVCAALADDMLRRLKFDNDTREKVVQLIEYHDANVVPSEKHVRRWLNKIGEEQFRRLLSIKIADGSAHNPDNLGDRIDKIYVVREVLSEVLSKRQCFTMRDLEVNGRDMIMIGIPEGPEVGAMLRKLMDLVLDGEAPNEKYHLIGLAVHMKAEGGSR